MQNVKVISFMKVKAVGNLLSSNKETIYKSFELRRKLIYFQLRYIPCRKTFRSCSLTADQLGFPTLLHRFPAVTSTRKSTKFLEREESLLRHWLSEQVRNHIFALHISGFDLVLLRSITQELHAHIHMLQFR